MEESAKNPKKNKNDSGDLPRKMVMLETASHGQLEKAAKKFKLTNGEYAAAAIAHFAESGLNPVAARAETLAAFANRLREEGRAGRQQTVDVGTRLIAIMRTWEKTLYVFLQQMEGGMVNHMEQIESNLLQQLVGLESSYFAPMVQMMVQSNIELHMSRITAERTGLFVSGKKEPEWDAITQASTRERDQQIVIQMREFMKNNRLDKPTLSPKPQPPAVPVKAPAAPATAPSAGATTPK